MAAVAPLEDEYSLVQIIGNHSVNVDGLAPRNLLQNIHGLNWPKPPLSIEHVTYTYIKPEDSAFLQQLADEWEADFAEHAVRVDKHKLVKQHSMIVLLQRAATFAHACVHVYVCGAGPRVWCTTQLTSTWLWSARFPA